MHVLEEIKDNTNRSASSCHSIKNNSSSELEVMKSIYDRLGDIETALLRD